MNVMLYPCIFCVAMLMYLFVLCATCLTVYVNSLVNSVVVILMLNFMEVLSVDEVLCWIYRVWSSKECVCCACVSEVISFRSLRAGSQVFALLILFLCVISHIMWSGKSLQLLCILPFCILCLSAIRMMVVKIILAVCLLVGIVV